MFGDFHDYIPGQASSRFIDILKANQAKAQQTDYVDLNQAKKPSENCPPTPISSAIPKKVSTDNQTPISTNLSLKAAEIMANLPNPSPMVVK